MPCINVDLRPPGADPINNVSPLQLATTVCELAGYDATSCQLAPDPEFAGTGIYVFQYDDLRIVIDDRTPEERCPA